MVPKLSAPLTKLIRTLEGVIWLGANVALVVAPIVSSHVSPADSIQWGSIMNTVVFASRQALKGIAIAQGVVGPPQQFLSAQHLASVEAVAGQVAGDVAGDVSQGATVEEVLAQITAAEQAAQTIQAATGTPAAQVATGLSPDPVTPPASPVVPS